MDKINYDDNYSESFRKYSVQTNMRTLLRLRPLLKAVGLGELLSSGKLEGQNIVQGLVKSLEEANLLNEFCVAVTGMDGHDFMGADVGNIMWLVHDFFVGLYWQMPPSWRGQLRASIENLVKLGQMSIAQKASELMRQDPGTGGTIPVTG